MSPKNTADMKLHQQKRMKTQTMISTISPLPVTSVFNWEDVHTILDSTSNVYGFSDSSGDEYEELEAATKGPVTRVDKMKKLMETDIDLVCTVFNCRQYLSH